MKRWEAKSPASDEQLALPFDRSPMATRSNGTEPLAVRIPDAVRMTGIGRSKLYELIASGDLEKTPSDSRQDFDNVYDFETAFRRDYVLALDEVA